MKTHVLITRFEISPGRYFVHAYGPYTETTARRHKKRVVQEHAKEMKDGLFTVNVCKMIDAE